MTEAKEQKGMEIVLCTGNKNKLKEFMQILGPDFPYKVNLCHFKLFLEGEKSKKLVAINNFELGIWNCNFFLYVTKLNHQNILPNTFTLFI